MKLVQLYIYIDSADVNGNIQTFSGGECVQQAIDYCYMNYVLPADVCKVSGMIEIVDPISGDAVQRSWPNPDLGWFRGELRKKYVESK